MQNSRSHPAAFFLMDTAVKTAYILAGGRSRRMGQDKLFAKCGMTSLVARTVGTCLGLFDTVKLVAREQFKFQELNCPVVIDWPDAEGPLAGIIAALRDCRDQCCLITAADLYDLNRETISNLKEAYAGEDYLGVREPDQTQPLCGIYAKSALPVLQSQAAGGNYRVTDALAHMHCRLLPFAGKRWRNINTPHDLEQIRSDHD